MGREHWVETPLQNVVLSKKGKKPKKLEPGEFKNSSPYIDIEAFETGNIKQYADDESSNHCQNDDVLVVWDGARFGLSGTNQKGAIGSTLACLTPVLIESGYLYRFIQRHYSTIQQKPKGMATPHVDPEVFWNLDFPLTSLSEQNRIVEKLDTILPKAKSAKARLEKISRILIKFRQSVLSAACSGRLTEDWREEHSYVDVVPYRETFTINPEYKELLDMPETWQWVALGNYVECSRGRFSVRPRNDPRYFGGGIPFIQIGDLPREGGYICSHTQTLNEAGLKVSKMFPKNTIAIAIVGATIGNTGILGYDMCFPDSMVGINTEDLSKNLFIDYYFRSEKENLRHISYAGGGQPNIKLELLNEYPFPLPPFEEQHEIVRRVEKLFSLADSIEVKYKKAFKLVEKIEQAVLAKAFRGELADQDPNDQPAAELLKRILLEKEKMKSQKMKTNNKHEKKR